MKKFLLCVVVLAIYPLSLMAYTGKYGVVGLISTVLKESVEKAEVETNRQKKRTYITDIVVEAPKWDADWVVNFLKEHDEPQNLKRHLNDLLFDAPQYDAVDLLEAVLDELGENADVNAQGATDGNTPLHHAAIEHSYKSAKMLLEAGANANIKNYKGQIPLDYARTPAMKKLLQKAMDKQSAQN